MMKWHCCQRAAQLAKKPRLGTPTVHILIVGGTLCTAKFASHINANGN
jgi:hypothetical protein